MADTRVRLMSFLRGWQLRQAAHHCAHDPLPRSFLPSSGQGNQISSKALGSEGRPTPHRSMNYCNKLQVISDSEGAFSLFHACPENTSTILVSQYTSHVTRHSSHVTCHTSHITSLTSHITHHKSHGHTSPITFTRCRRRNHAQD